MSADAKGGSPEPPRDASAEAIGPQPGGPKLQLGKEIAKGAAWMVLFKILDRTIGLTSMSVLARLLVPGDFGLVALATSIIAVLELLGAFSFDVALIQNPKATRDHYDTAWTFNALFGFVCAAGLVLLAAPASRFYAEPRLAAVMIALAFGQVVGGLENIAIVAFRKDFQFKKEFRFLYAKRLAGAVVTISLAFAIESHWALVAGILTGRVVGVALSYALRPYRPRFSLAARRELFHFSKWLLVNNFLGFLNNRSADFMLGKMAGTSELGVYTLSSAISSLPTSELAAPINRAVFPGYAKMAVDPEGLRRGVLDVLSIIVLIGLPIGAGITAVANPLVRAILGEKWLDAIPIIRVLGIYGALHVLNTNVNYVFLAMGKPRLQTVVSAVHAGVLVAALFAGIRAAGVAGAAWAFLVAVLAVIPVNYLMLSRLLGVRPKDALTRFWRPAAASGVMWLFVEGLRRALPMPGTSLEAAGKLIGCIVFGVTIYAVTVLFFWRLSGRPAGAEQFALERVRSVLRRFVGGRAAP